MEGNIDLHSVFVDALNNAIVHGREPSRWIGLGDETRSAIDAVAAEHPDATADHIACAYDSFAREHGPTDADPVGDEPRRLEARRDRFRRA